MPDRYFFPGEVTRNRMIRRLERLLWEVPVMAFAVTSFQKITYGSFDGLQIIVLVEFIIFYLFFNLFIVPVDYVAKYYRYWMGVVLTMALFAFLAFEAHHVQSLWTRGTVMKSRLDEVIRKAPQAVIVSNKDDEIIAFNPAAQRLTGFKETEALGHLVESLLEPSLARAHRNAFRQVAGRLAIHETEWVHSDGRLVSVRRKDGRYVPCRVYAVGARFGEEIDFFGVLIPIDDPPASVPARTPR